MTTLRTSAFGGKADIRRVGPECPLLAISGHQNEDLKSENFRKWGYGKQVFSIGAAGGGLDAESSTIRPETRFKSGHMHQQHAGG